MVKKISLVELSLVSGYQKEVVKAMLEKTVNYFKSEVIQNREINIEIAKVGRLLLNQQKCGVQFIAGFAQAKAAPDGTSGQFYLQKNFIDSLPLNRPASRNGALNRTQV